MNKGEKNWNTAVVLVNKLNIPGHHDWRLPTKDELEIILRWDPDKLKEVGFVNAYPNGYWWSATTEGQDINSVYRVNRYEGEEHISSGEGRSVPGAKLTTKDRGELIWPVHAGSSRAFHLHKGTVRLSAAYACKDDEYSRTYKERYFKEALEEFEAILSLADDGCIFARQ